MDYFGSEGSQVARHGSVQVSILLGQWITLEGQKTMLLKSISNVSILLGQWITLEAFLVQSKRLDQCVSILLGQWITLEG